MLNPRAARMPDTRDKTPGSFWTRQFRVWRVNASVDGGGAARGEGARISLESIFHSKVGRGHSSCPRVETARSMAQLARNGALTVVDDGMDSLLCAPLGRVNDREGRRSLSRVRELKVVGDGRRADFVRAPLGRCRRRREEPLRWLLLACGRRGGATAEHREGHDGGNACRRMSGLIRARCPPHEVELSWSVRTLLCAEQREKKREAADSPTPAAANCRGASRRSQPGV